MTGRVKRWAVLAVVASASVAGAQSSPAALASGGARSEPVSTVRGQAPAPDGTTNEPELVMRTAGQPDRTLRVVKRVPIGDGDSLVDVKDVANGQVFTLPGKLVAKLQASASRAPAPQAEPPAQTPPPVAQPLGPPPVADPPRKPPVQPRAVKPRPAPPAAEPQREAAVLLIPPPELPESVVAATASTPTPTPAPAVVQPPVERPAATPLASETGGPFNVTLSSPTVLPVSVPTVMPTLAAPAKPDRWAPARQPLK